MSLLDLYLTAVGIHLPRGSDKRDILAELRGHLETKMIERREDLGRNLTEAEQEAALAEFGDPFTVATRYGKKSGGFAFGPFRLISRAAFPVYVGVLLFTLGINIVIGLVEILLTSASPALLARRIAITMLVLFPVYTLVFAGVDYFVRRSARTQRGAPESWLFWTPYLKYVPKWYSASGLVFMSALAVGWVLWWSLWPDVPALLIGPAVAPLQLSPSWQRFQLYLLGLIALGVAQRAFSLVRPDINWFPSAVRLVINLLCVGMLYRILSNPFVVVPDAAAASAETVELARRINTTTGGLIRGFGFYWVLNALWLSLVCAGHIAYRVGRWRQSAVGELR
ncbi:MAG TPA: hypothetical protein VFR18_27515 [Terriglobia bacterium]|nr:hypothetical protein [Terriglobia bacterium]